ncbi:MAG: hypothetical protein P4L50_30365, partial [Anaerolineaceae bacterium]|nr:hypothetical protein [Anaerolineaceae bacterium]
NDATGYLFTLFLTHVGNLNTVKLNQRRFAPTSAHIAGIKCPHHWNTQLTKAQWCIWMYGRLMLRWEEIYDVAREL